MWGWLLALMFFSIWETTVGAGPRPARFFPLGGEQAAQRLSHRHHTISIHASLAGGDAGRAGGDVALPAVSIHASLAGGDGFPSHSKCGLSGFQSTPPLREATHTQVVARLLLSVSIHASLAGGDAPSTKALSTLAGFNPRLPCGRRPVVVMSRAVPPCFNPRLPCGRRHSTIAIDLHRRCVSIHASLAGGDLSAHGGAWRGACFNPRLPCGRRQPTQGDPSIAECFNPRLPCGR